MDTTHRPGRQGIDYVMPDGMVTRMRLQDHGETAWPEITLQIHGQTFTCMRAPQVDDCKCTDCIAANPVRVSS